jgi:hypothetical protein
MKFTYAPGDQPVQGYTIRRGLGRGGFGEVYHAISQRGKEVALKLVQRHLDVELRGVGQCLNLKHPHLVVVYDILKVANDDHWIVMEFVAGETLDQVLTRHPQGLPQRQVLAWLRGVCEGVAYLHDHGIVHRDLKPGNLFLEKGVVKIGDYGLSKFISASQRSGHTESVGTVYYMAPEVSRGRYGKEVDQYALGVILYQMLTGRLPFDGESPGEILMKHLVAEPDLTALAEPFRPVVARLLDKDPQRRFPSVAEALAQLLPQFPAGAQASPEPAPTQTYTEEAPADGQAEAAESSGDSSGPGRSWRLGALLSFFGGRARSKARHYQEADPDRASLIQILIDNGIDAAKDIAQVFQALGEEIGHDWLERAKAVRILAENGKEASAIVAFLNALRKQPGQDLAPKVRVLEILLDHGIEDGDDIVRVLRALGDSAGQELAGKITVIETLLDHGIEASEDIEQSLEAFGHYPTPDHSAKVTVLKVLLDHGIEGSEDITRILHALGTYRHPDQLAGVKTVQVLVENGVEDSADIARVLSAMGKCPGQDLAGTVRAIETMVENNLDAADIARVLHVLSQCPEQDVASKAKAVRSLAADGMEVEDIERSLRVG